MRGERSGRGLALIVCGALCGEVERLARARGWRATIFPIPDRLHLDPRRIAAAVDRKLEQIRDRFRRTLVVFGDCGTAGALDQVVVRHGAVRLPGPHCFEMLAGREFERLIEEEPASYFLTDFLVRHWEDRVLAGLGLDRRPDLTAACFAGFARVVYLRQSDDPALAEKAGRIADSLGLPLEIRDAGPGLLAERLTRLVHPDS